MKEDSFDDELFHFFKSSYETEFTRRDKLSDRINLGVTLLTILGGLVAFYLSSFKLTPFCAIYLLFYAPLISGIVLMSISLWYFGLAIAKGRKYRYISHPHTLSQYVENMRAANKPLDQTTEKQIRSEFIQTVSGQYQVCTTLNFYVNTERQKKFLNGLKFATWSLALLLVTSLPFFIFKGGFHNEPQNVNIINPVEVKHVQ